MTKIYLELNLIIKENRLFQNLELFLLFKIEIELINMNNTF